jgi:hypothetical protein
LSFPKGIGCEGTPFSDHILRGKQVWRVAFFSRMEERKGVKVFVDALNLLDSGQLKQSQVLPLAPSLAFTSCVLDK